jgi:oligoribonuclease NrnB/cAMP/cGMP phosphodiesterase (DHH superfamily)
MHRGLVDVKKGDIIANLAYDRRCSLWFDHHSSNQTSEPFDGAFDIAPSAARVVYEYYQNNFSRNFESLVNAADKIDSAQLSLDEVLNPKNHPYVLLNSTLRGFCEEDHLYWNKLVSLLGKMGIENILKDPEINTRSQQSISNNHQYKNHLETHTTIQNHVSITDFRSWDIPPSGNRFLIFSMYPETSVNIRIRYDRLDRTKVIASIGHSIFNRTCQVDVGRLCSKYNGGGHQRAGSCNFHKNDAEKILDVIVNTLLQNKNTMEKPD